MPEAEWEDRYARFSCRSFGDLVVREQVPVASGIRAPPRRRGMVKLTAESFGDRRTDVPGGVAGLVERVVVVGAGIAGLTVANALTHAGLSVLCWRLATGSVAGCTRLTWPVRRLIWAGHGYICQSGIR
jgi:hypothetical protein